jgi:hypothetical protein
VISFDPGVKHLAVAVYAPGPMRLRLLDLANISASNAANSVAKLVRYLHNMLPLMYGCGWVVVIERQPGRNNRSITLVEGAIAGFFRGRHMQVHHVDTRFKWRALPDEAYRGLDGRQRKATAVSAVQAWLTANPQEASVTAKFRNGRKQDDMADSLVQALALCRQSIRTAPA